MQIQTITPLEERNIITQIMQAEENAPPRRTYKLTRNATMVILMREAGLRVAEVCRLLWSNLYWQNNPVNAIELSADICKYQQPRSVPVSTRLRSWVIKHRTAYAAAYPKQWPVYAFAGKSPGKRLTTRQVERIIRNAAMEAIGRPVHPHALRHTFATRLMRVVDTPTVQALLGHKHLSSTQRYCHPGRDDLEWAIKQASNPANGQRAAERIW